MAADKNISFSIAERLAAIKLIDAFKGTLSLTGILMEDLKKLAIAPEEWEKAGLTKTPNGDGTERWNWNPETPETEVTLKDETVRYLGDEIKRKSEANEITLADSALVSLDKKL